MDKKNVRIALDLDNTIRDFNSQLIKVYLKYYPYHRSLITPLKDWDDYEVHHYFPIKRDIYDFMYENPKEIFVDAPMIPGAYDAIKTLKKCGFYFLVVSSQKPEVQEHSLQWIDNMKIKPMEIYFDEDKHNLVDSFDYLIDDSPTQLKNVFDASGKVIIFDQPYNRDLPLDVEGGSFRAKNWHDVVCHFLEDRLNEPLIRQIYRHHTLGKSEIPKRSLEFVDKDHINVGV